MPARTSSQNLDEHVRRYSRFALLVLPVILGVLLHPLFASVVGSSPTASAAGTVTGELKKWHPITVSFNGPAASERDDNPHPFLDYRLNVTFTGPDGKSYLVPGFFAGDGKGGSSGNVWQVRFAPDQVGEWSYTASFRSGSNVAIDLNAEAGVPNSFDGAKGSFTIAALDSSAPGFLRWGRLEYTGKHYLKFRDGPYWIKGGADSPENFMGYKGFDNTVDQGGIVKNFTHEYTPHVDDWNSGDPNFTSADTGYDGRAIIGALNYLGKQHVNSIYLLPMNLGGDGQETYPFVGAANNSFDKTHYDISKLEQWNIVFEHAQRQGVALHVVLAETEQQNENWLDNGNLGAERKLFFRELIARFGYVLALKWNLSEENDYSVAKLREFTDYIKALDWAGHPISVHTHPNNFSDYKEIVGEERFTATSIQYNPDKANDYVESWRTASAEAGRPWVIDMDENNPAGVGLTDSNANELRKRVLYDVYFSGGNIEWYGGYHDLPLGGDLRMEDFRTREAMWTYMWYARRFMQENLPFWEMNPADNLLSDENNAFGGGQIFAAPGEVYAIYLPNASAGGILDLSTVAKTIEFTMRWYNPRSGEFVGNPTSVIGGSALDLGKPPSDPNEDWVILLNKESAPEPEPVTPLYMPMVTS
ncbi:MAG: DUF5060 domain-containing protein [Chloroflexales bacterium]|nr:DUF5060 domain-containing protein [Chloroflexales bacterium]